MGKALKNKELSEIDEEATQMSNMTSIVHGFDSNRHGSIETLGTMMTNTARSGSGVDPQQKLKLTAIKEVNESISGVETR